MDIIQLELSTFQGWVLPSKILSKTLSVTE